MNKARFNLAATGEGYKGLLAIEAYLAKSGLPVKLIHLLKLRASQINGCAYCLDMHWKDLRALGETEQRLYGLDAWREANYYTDQERAALEWVEAVTLIIDGHVSDAIYESVKAHFNDKEMADLTLAAALINAWNRLAVASRAVAGNYKPAAHAQQFPMTIDPIQLELMRNLFEAAADEMGITLQRVAFSANIKERRDFSCALFDPDGALLAQAAHIPVHLGSMGDSVRAVLDRLGKLDEGDVAIVNDPFAGGTHLPDITLVAPVYAKDEGRKAKDEGGRMKDEKKSDPASGASLDSSFILPPSSLILIGYVANRAHHADVGGKSPGSMTLSRHIDEEGFRIEPALLYRGGAVVDDLLSRFLAAVRTPEERLGDLDAQIAANRVGAAALLRMIELHGPEYVQAAGRALLDYSQAFLARTIDAIPDGEYRFDDVLDDDGTGYGPVAIRAIVRIAGERAVVDLSGCDKQVAGCVNCPASVARAAVYYCFCCLLDEHAPLNAGCFRNIDVITQPGTVVDAQFPAAVVAGNTETSQRVVDVVFGALAKALPGKIPAASCGTMNSVALGSDNWTYYETIGGGSGASPDADGASAVQCHMTNTLNTPAEALEMQYPLRVRRFERAPGSGGVGNHVGGDGIIREIEALAPCEGTVITDRRISRPYGLAGGKPAQPGANSINDTPIAGKSKVKLSRGDVLRIVTPGGGGFGAG